MHLGVWRRLVSAGHQRIPAGQTNELGILALNKKDVQR